MITHAKFCDSWNGNKCDCGGYDQGIPIPNEDAIVVPMVLLRRIELALLLVTTEYTVKPIPTKLFKEIKQLMDELKEVTNG